MIMTAATWPTLDAMLTDDGQPALAAAPASTRLA